MLLFGFWYFHQYHSVFDTMLFVIQVYPLSVLYDAFEKFCAVTEEAGNTLARHARHEMIY